MKQYITYEQLNQLSHQGKQKLHEWLQNRQEWTPDPRPILIDWVTLTIGQMIEFLDDHGVDYYDAFVKEWKSDGMEDRYPASELCDALWNAVKDVLEK